MARKRKDPFRRRRSARPTKLTREQKVRQVLRDEAYVGTTNGPRWVIYTTKLGKLTIHIFRAPFAAKHLFDLMVEEDELQWVDDECVQTESGLVLKGNELRRVAEMELARVEREWFSLSERYHDDVRHMRSDRPYVERPDPHTVRKRNSRRGMILAKTLAAEMGMKPREFRSKLRRLGVEKPDKGWAWRTPEEAARMKALVRLGHTRVVSVDFSRAGKREDSIQADASEEVRSGDDS